MGQLINIKGKTNKPKTPTRCKAKTKAGFPCRSFARTPDGLCYYHSRSKEEQAILQEQAQAARKMNKAKPHELMRQIIESNPIIFMQPYLDSLGIRIVFVPDENDPLILHPTAVQDPSSNGSTLFGISKDGRVIVSKHKDLEAQQRAAERLFDRVYGKPKQTSIIATGADNDASLNLVPFDEARQREVAAILEAAQRPSHSLPTPNPPTPNNHSNN
jgi:hypothetical protein